MLILLPVWENASDPAYTRPLGALGRPPCDIKAPELSWPHFEQMICQDVCSGLTCPGEQGYELGSPFHTHSTFLYVCSRLNRYLHPPCPDFFVSHDSNDEVAEPRQQSQFGTVTDGVEPQELQLAHFCQQLAERSGRNTPAAIQPPAIFQKQNTCCEMRLTLKNRIHLG